jgi:hypothetical protein
MRRPVALVLVVLAAGCAHQPAGWQPLDTPPPVNVAVNHQPDIGEIAWRGTLELEHSMVAVLAALADLEHYPAWLYHCHTLETRPDEWGPARLRLLIDAPWPLADRELWLDNRLRTSMGERSLVIVSTIAPAQAPLPGGTVRVDTLENRFQVQPLGPVRTRLTFETRVDAGGHLPALLLSRAARAFPQQSLQALAKRLEGGDYALENLDTLPVTFEQLRAMLAPE